jgi:phosphoenolpyruvate carboxylase
VQAEEAGVKPTPPTFFKDALISPVLTAHPTAAQSTSMRNTISRRLLAERDLPLTPKERAANLHLLRAHRHAVADPHAALPS